MQEAVCRASSRTVKHHFSAGRAFPCPFAPVCGGAVLTHPPILGRTSNPTFPAARTARTLTAIWPSPSSPPP